MTEQMDGAFSVIRGLRYELRETNGAPADRCRRRYVDHVWFERLARIGEALHEGALDVREVVVRREPTEPEHAWREVEAIHRRGEKQTTAIERLNSEPADVSTTAGVG